MEYMKGVSSRQEETGADIRSGQAEYKQGEVNKQRVRSLGSRLGRKLD